jgi:beta-galactosidase
VPHDAQGLEIEPLDDATRADALVAKRIEQLGLPTFLVDPSDVFLTVHEDAAGVAKVAFVMNPTPDELVAKVAVRGATALVDVMPERRPGERITRVAGSFEVAMPPRSVRLFAIEG